VDDREIVNRIDALIEEEHTLRSGVHGLVPADRTRLEHLEEHLDQLWDLLRRRRALRDAGVDPGEAREQPVSQVEHYLQ
jgi:hypothetical protein